MHRTIKATDPRAPLVADDVGNTEWRVTRAQPKAAAADRSLGFLLYGKIEAPAICWTGASSCHVVDVGGDGELTTRHCCTNAAMLAAVPVIS